MGLHLLFAAVFLVQSVSQSVSAPTAWAGPDDEAQPSRTAPLEVKVSEDSRSHLNDFRRRAAARLAERIVDTAPESFSVADRLSFREAIEKIAAPMPLITNRETHKVVMTNRIVALRDEIDRFRQLRTTALTAEELDTQAALVLRLLIELDLAAAATNFDAGVDIAREAVEIHKSQQTEAWWSNAEKMSLGAAVITTALSAVFSIVATVGNAVVAVTSLPENKTFSTCLEACGWGFVAAVPALVGYAIAHDKSVDFSRLSSSLRKAQEDRRQESVYEAALDLATREIAFALLRTSRFEGRHPEFAVVGLLTRATKLDTRELFTRALCQLRLRSYNVVKLDHDPAPRAN